MVLLDLAEAQTGVAQPDVLEVVLAHYSDVLPALDVVAAGLADHEGVLEVTDVGLQRVRADPRAKSAFESRLDPGGARERAGGRRQHVDQVVEL